MATAPPPAATVKSSLMAPSLLTVVLNATAEAPTAALLHTEATVDPLLTVDHLHTVEDHHLMVATVPVLDLPHLPDMEVTEATTGALMDLAPPALAMVLLVPPDLTLLSDLDTAVPLPHTEEVTPPALATAAASHVTLAPPLPLRDTEAAMVAPPLVLPTSKLARTVFKALTSQLRSATKTPTTSRRSPDKEEFPSIETFMVTRLVT